MKKNIVLTFLKAIWSKGLVAKICVVSLSTVLVGGATTGVVLLQNKKIEKTYNDMDEEKKNAEVQEITNYENENNEIEEEKVNEENSETSSQNETPKANETSKEITTEQGVQPSLQEQNSVQRPEKQETQQPQETQPSVSHELIVAQRKINQGYRDYLTSDSFSKIVRFGVVDINGNGEEELLLYTYDPTTSSDRGPNKMLLFDGEVCGAGEGWGYLENIEYCSSTKHFVTTNYYDDGSYDFRIYEFNGYFGPELIYSDGDGDWPFVFHVDVNGKYSWGGRYNLYYTQKLTDSQVAYVVQKINEFLPTRTKATAPYLVNEENLNKYLPIDDAGIVEQIKNKQ